MDSIPKRRREHTEEVNVEGNEDRISNLPTSLIGHILSFLPTKNAVATSVLSTKWKYLWTSIATLDFDDGLVDVWPTPRKSRKQRQSLVETSFINFVYRVLTRNVSDLQKFHLKCTRSYDVSHVNIWISTALSRNPRELHLSHIGNLPRELFTSTSLVVLKLVSSWCRTIVLSVPIGSWCRTIVLNVPTLVCLRSLKILVIDYFKFLDDDSIYRLCSSCPVLEDLSIGNCDLGNISVLNISAPNLRFLTINCWTSCYQFGCSCDSDCKYKIVLNTPNLQHLKYKDFAAKGYSMSKLDALVKADISFVERCCGVRDRSIEKLAKADFFKRMTKVQWLRLSIDSIEVFELWRLLQCRHLIYLELGNQHQYVGWKLLLDIVERLPLLETLIFGGLSREGNQTTSCWYQPPNVPSCLL
ncbi:F-box/LRR-repeat protein At3g26922-like [Cornus florida]|uniref:F-box/LRR-repeat protein At3g26922-like n=1 Tax=Cornus florida TaxID=4283 RepID=UPI0028A1EE37|nr:F-box/LRR-repeat protein At3g26922-like [Cornus florida]